MRVGWVDGAAKGGRMRPETRTRHEKCAYDGRVGRKLDPAIKVCVCVWGGGGYTGKRKMDGARIRLVVDGQVVRWRGSWSLEEPGNLVAEEIVE